MKTFYHPHVTRPEGFTIVELMVTIFVAALFISGLVTLTTTYNYFMAQARQTAVADNLAYRYLQKYTRTDYQAESWFTCDTTNGNGNQNDRSINPTASGTVLDSGTLDPDSNNLPGPLTYSITAVAPYGCADINQGLPIQVQAVITYGAANRTVSHAAFAKSTCKNATPGAPCTNTYGLVGWWPLNGDAKDYAGNNDGIVYGATSAYGQGGSANTAYSFNGTSNYMSFSNSTDFNLKTLTMSTWIKRSAGSQGGQVFGKEMQYKIGIMNNYAAQLLVSRYGTSWDQNVHPNVTFLDDTWYNLTATINSDTATSSIYLNGSKIAQDNNLGGPIVQFNTNILDAGTFDPAHNGGFFGGSIDDLRLYNRVLTDKEIKTLYDQGAQ